MTAEMVDECLAHYREYTARCDFLEKEIAELERWIEQMRSMFVEDNVHITQTLSDMPHSTGVSNPVEKLAFMDIEQFTPDYIKTVETEVRARKRELQMKRPTVIFVDAWLKCLTSRERFIVKHQMLDGMFWREVVSAFEKEYGETYTRQRLKKIRDNAVEKMHEIAK